MSSCYDFSSYTATAKTALENHSPPYNQISVSVWGAHQELAQYATDLGNGETCANTFAQFTNDISGYVLQKLVQPGFSFAKPSLSDFTYQEPVTSGWYATIPGEAPGCFNQGLKLSVTEYQLGAGNTVVPVDRGSFQFAYLILSAGACMPTSFPCNVPYVTSSLQTYDLLTGTWPMVASDSGMVGSTIGWFVEIDIFDAVTPPSFSTNCSMLTGCGPGPFTYGGNPVQAISQYSGVDCVYTMNYQGLSAFTDTTALWNCVSSGYSCGGAGGDRQGFLIPSPATPTPGQQSSTSPPNQSTLYFSNHTFQFTNNFGRK